MNYQILPFNFERFDDRSVFVSNYVGEYLLMTNSDFSRFIDKTLTEDEDVFLNL